MKTLTLTNNIFLDIIRTQNFLLYMPVIMIPIVLSITILLDIFLPVQTWILFIPNTLPMIIIAIGLTESKPEGPLEDSRGKIIYEDKKYIIHESYYSKNNKRIIDKEHWNGEYKKLIIYGLKNYRNSELFNFFKTTEHNKYLVFHSYLVPRKLKDKVLIARI